MKEYKTPKKLRDYSKRYYWEHKERIIERKRIERGERTPKVSKSNMRREKNISWNMNTFQNTSVEKIMSKFRVKDYQPLRRR